MIWSCTDPPPSIPAPRGATVAICYSTHTVQPPSQGPLQRPPDPSGKGHITDEDLGIEGLRLMGEEEEDFKAP